MLLHCLQLLDPVLPSGQSEGPALFKEQNLEVFLGKQAKEASLEFESESLSSPQHFFPISLSHWLPGIFLGKGMPMLV